MADVTIGELPSLNTMEADALIPVEHDGEAKSMSGTVLGNYVYGLVEDDVEIIAEIIAVGPKGEDGVSPTLSSSKSGKTTTIYYTDAAHPTQTVLATLRDGADGSGTGDMLRATYDADDDGIVDDSEKLGGELPSYYMAASARGASNGVAALDVNGHIFGPQSSPDVKEIADSSYTVSAEDEGYVLRTTATGGVTLTIPDTITRIGTTFWVSAGVATTITTSGNASGDGGSIPAIFPQRSLVLCKITRLSSQGYPRWCLYGMTPWVNPAS